MSKIKHSTWQLGTKNYNEKWSLIVILLDLHFSPCYSIKSSDIVSFWSRNDNMKISNFSVSPELLHSLACLRLLRNLSCEQLHFKVKPPKKGIESINYEWKILINGLKNQIYFFAFWQNIMGLWIIFCKVNIFSRL